MGQWTRRICQWCFLLLLSSACGNARPARHVLPEPTVIAIAPPAETIELPGEVNETSVPISPTRASLSDATAVATDPPTIEPSATATTVPAPLVPEPSADTRILRSGVGESESAPFVLHPGPAFFQITHPTATFFAAFLLNAHGDHLAVLANANVPISGTQFFGIDVEDDYHLHVITDDEWSVAVTQLTPERYRNGAAMPSVLRGDGLAISPVLGLTPGILAVAWQHRGTYPFALMLWTADGRQIGKIVSNGDVPMGTARFDVPQDGAYLLNIQADGPWSLSLEGP